MPAGYPGPCCAGGSRGAWGGAGSLLSSELAPGGEDGTGDLQIKFGVSLTLLSELGVTPR